MIIIPAIYILFQLIILVGYLKFISAPSRVSDKTKISVITAAKNETHIIRNFISSIRNLNYPRENFELVIVDDNSVDETYNLVSDFVKQDNNIRIIKAGNKLLPSKRGALLKGIENSIFNHIVITDADCNPSSGWLKSYSAMFEKGNEFVFSPAPFYQEKNTINNVSCIENLRNQYLSFSLTRYKCPYTAAARNLGFSKEAFMRIGGFTNTLDSLSGDDDLLLREAVKNKLKVKAFFDKDALVYSFTKKNMGDYLNQRARHTQSSLHYLVRHKILLGFWHILNLFMFFSPVLMFINFDFIWAFLIKMITDTVIFHSVQKSFNYRFNTFQIFFLNMIYEIFIVLNFFNSFFRRVEWE